MNSLLVKVIIASVALHVVIGLILGGITIIDHIIPDKAQFDEAPETPEEIPPVKIEVKPQTTQIRDQTKCSANKQPPQSRN